MQTYDPIGDDDKSVNQLREREIRESRRVYPIVQKSKFEVREQKSILHYSTMIGSSALVRHISAYGPHFSAFQRTSPHGFLTGIETRSRRENVEITVSRRPSQTREGSIRHTRVVDTKRNHVNKVPCAGHRSLQLFAEVMTLLFFFF
jgi:hypothetical protein